MHENLLIYPLADYKPNIADPKWVEALTKLAEGAEIMILDTLRMFHDLDENDGGQMGLVISNMKQIASKTNCSIVFVHHTTKSSALNGQGAAQQASRGSSVLTDNIRWQSYLSGMSEDEAHKLGICGESRGRYVKFGVSKQNFGKPFDEIWMERRSAIDPDIEAGYTLNTLNLNPAPTAIDDRGGRNDV
jgi:RecA-family ATPase